MRSAIRLALPILAATTALMVTGCNDDDGEGSFGTVGGSGQADGGSSDGGSSDGGSTGGEESAPPSDDTSGGGSSGGGDAGGTALTAEQLEGDWYTGTDPLASNLEIRDGEVLFLEDLDQEGDVCEGRVTDAGLELDHCRQYGEESWTDMSATWTLESENVLNVTWSSGQTQTYRNAENGGFSQQEIDEINDTLARMRTLGF